MGWMLNLRVTSGPSKTIPMTRSPSRLGTDTNLCPRVKVKQNSRLDKFSSQVPFHLTQRDSIHSRINQLVRPNRFFLQTRYVEDCEIIQDIKSPLPLCHKSLHPCIKTSCSSTSVDRFSNKTHPDHGRCILIRLGHSNTTIPIQRDFQGWSQVPSYQCKGTSDSLFALLLVEEKGAQILIKTDSQVALKVLMKGGSLTPLLCQISHLIWNRICLMQQNLVLSHIQGSLNVKADQLSRLTPRSTEWSLQKSTFLHLCSVFKINPQVDLFATDLNHQVKTYISPCPDPQAYAVNALTVTWRKWKNLYLFPPTALISRALAKLRLENFDSALLISRDFKARPWFANLNLFQYKQYKFTTHLHQVVNGKIVTQGPVTLIGWLLYKTTTQEDSLQMQQI